MDYHFILQNDLFKNNLILYYEGNKLKYCKDDITIKNKPKAYCDQEFSLYKFEKIKYDIHKIMKNYFLEKGVNLIQYDEYIIFKNKMSKNILDLFMSNLDLDIIVNKNKEFEEFSDIIILENDGNSIYLLCENSDYFYFFQSEGS